MLNPFGPKEYLLHLSQAVRELAPDSHDSYLKSLEVRSQIAQFKDFNTLNAADESAGTGTGWCKID
jgi:hypothetical protein